MLLRAPLRGGYSGFSDAYERYSYLLRVDRNDFHNRGQQSVGAQHRIETQNVRGFIDKTRSQWLAALQRTPLRARPLTWIIQETHVHSHTDVDQLVAAWARLWGRSHGNLVPPLSYWSVGSSAAGGMAILLSPAVAELSQPWQQER